MSDMLNKTPWHLWLVGLLALIWNAYPAYDFVPVRERIRERVRKGGK